MNINSMFPSKYLKASDADENPTLTIKDVVYEEMKNRDDQDEQKPVLYFVEVDKGMVLNRTNAKTIANMYGEDTDGWIGERVVLTAVDVDAFGQTQRALRISARKPSADKNTLIDRYSKLWERGKKAGVEGIENYAIRVDMPESEIKELGIELKAKVEAAESF